MSKVCLQCGATYEDQASFCRVDGSSLRLSKETGELVNTVIADRYLITRELGEGGMGRVYLGTHVRMPLQVAIKVLRADLRDDPDAVVRFNREARNACSISSENVAKVFDFGETEGGLLYLAMEYVPGATLASILKEEVSLAPIRAAALTFQVASGLDAAHRLDIFHRDVKPENILVERHQDGSETAKVVDFGISKAVTTDSQVLTSTGFILGTLPYMSPEQVVGGQIDGRSDVYSLGLVSIMMFTGALPFSSPTPEAGMMLRLYQRPRLLSELRPDVDWPDQLQKVFDRVLALDVQDRYPTAGSFAAELAEAVTRWQASTTTGAAAARRSRRGVLAGAVAAVLAAVVLLWARSGSREAEAPLAHSTMAASPTPRTASVPARQVPADRAPAAKATATAARTGSARKDGAPGARTDSVASRELARISSGLAPGTITSDIARNALTTISSLLPRLHSSEDSLRARLGQANAYFFLGETGRSCAVLRDLRESSAASTRELIDEQIDAAGCTTR